MPVDVSAGEARLLALSAQGLNGRRPAKPSLAHVRQVISRLGAVQIDAVNVLVRSHYLPVYSRLGPYDPALFDKLAYTRGEVFETWAHQASFAPIELHPLLRWRMAAHETRWERTRAVIEERRPGYVKAVLDQVTASGPLKFGELDDPGRREKDAAMVAKYAASSLLWWRPSDGKSVLEGLFDVGRLAVAGRKGFERLFDLAERVLPANVLTAPTPDPLDAHRELVRRAMAALGIATARDVARYFELSAAATKTAVGELIDAGDLVPARVEGWRQPGVLDPAVRPTAKRDVRALLSPFDSLLWERDRVERIFNFRHSFEIYVPAAKRRYGYYVLPFLLGDALVARVDLKADRADRTLLVNAAHVEDGVPPRDVAGPLREELGVVAAWLGLDRVQVADRGNLARAIR